MSEEEIELLEETIELKKEQGCRVIKCGVIENNTKLRLENLKLKAKNEEQEKIIELMVDSIKHYKTVGDGTLNTRPATREEKIGWFRQKAKELINNAKNKR